MSDPVTSSEEPIRKVLAELQRRFRVAGRGSVARVERELGLSAGFFKEQRRAGRRTDLEILFKALAALEVEPAEFFTAVLGSADPVAVFLAESTALRRCQKRLPRILVLESERGPRDAGSPPGRGGGHGTLLAELDGLRFEDPEQVIRRARRVMPGVADPEVAPLLGVYASACRIAARYDEALMVLGRGLEIAQVRDDQQVLGNLIQRAGYVMAVRGRLEMALALAERATLIATRRGDLAGIGLALHDQGTWHYHLGHVRRARVSIRSAAGYLERVSAEASDAVVERNRFSCWMSLALIHRGLGELETAGDYLRQAREHPREAVGSHLYGKLVALQASLARESERYRRSEELYREALEIFRPIAPYDSALCGLELARVQLRRGRTTDAYDTARGLLPLVDPLEKNPAAAAALTELLRVALAGRGLSEALLQRVAGKLRDGQSQWSAGSR